MPSLASQLLTETKAAIYARGLAVATSLGLVTTSWAAGDPTRSLYHFLSEILEALEVNVAGYVASGFLDYATGDWLTILAEQLYGVTRTAATYASTTVTLSNGGGGYYEIAAGDIRVQNSASGATYTNTSGGTLTAALTPGATLVIDITADETGSGSNAGAGDIDTIVTSMLGVTCANATAAIGVDEEEDADLRERCRARLGMLSPNGPRDVYDYVVRSPELMAEFLGGAAMGITRSRTIADDSTGAVTVYVAGASGAVSGDNVTAAQAALEAYAAPLCITPTAVNCSAVPIAVTYSVWMYTSVGEDEAAIEATISDAIDAVLLSRPIGGDIVAPATTGKLYQSILAAAIRAAYPDHIFRVSVATPSGDTALAINEVVTAGTHSGTVHLETDP